MKRSELKPSERQGCLRRGLVWMGRLVVFVMALLFILLVALWVRHNQRVVLPQPSGDYAVGRREFDWVDPDRLDPFGSSPEEHRELMVWVWYPADPSSGGNTPVEYLPAGWRDARQKEMGVAALFLAQNPGTIRAQALQNAPLSNSGSSYPVIVMQPGLGPIASDYTTLAEDLASHGYIVFGSTPTYSSSVVVFEDGRTILASDKANVTDTMSAEEAKERLDALVMAWAQDNIFVLDQVEELNTSDASGFFTGKLDLENIGIFGHSFGGASALQTCSLDPRCRAGADLDGTLFGEVVKKGVTQPFLFLWNETSYDEPTALAMKEFSGNTNGEVFQFNIQGMRHFNFSDFGVQYQPVLRLMDLLGPINGGRGLEITSAYLRAFFDLELKHTDTTLLDHLSPQYPEVQMGLPIAP